MATSQNEIPAEILLQIIQLQYELSDSNLAVDALLVKLTAGCQSLTGATGAVFELIEGDELVYRAATGTAESQIGLRIPIKHSFSGLSIQDHNVLICADSEEDHRVNREACRKVGLRSMLVSPLLVAGEIVGVLKVLSTEVGAFSEMHRQIIHQITPFLSRAIKNAFERYESNQQINTLAQLASHDSLTGLLNRSSFYDLLRQGLSKAENFSFRLGVAMFDLDHLKKINDAFGHQAGDHYIQGFAKRLKDVSEETATVARLGGDEFGLFIPFELPPDELKAQIQSISDNLEIVLDYKGNQFPIKVSYGVSIYPDDSDQIMELVQIADERMYTNKRHRKSLEN
ncbi:diguanylate cyclase (GGDEF) domain protein [Leptospira ryugenii]|uniref:diguanylate cyclase n=1 Tax=Leptospira ryugenii TaxID=1917863 RepID=A0A2P2DYU4_9LEPT|nr:sensor domain-containing diguanylate cyclase [Leptospira ryugenii]GBF49776.1 diguanylate cyclase (GGDEF) domain protein [Leptospira ryugenii]